MLDGLLEVTLNRWEFKNNILHFIEGWKDKKSDFIILN